MKSFVFLFFCYFVTFIDLLILIHVNLTYQRSSWILFIVLLFFLFLLLLLLLLLLQTGTPENVLIIRALRDSNVPKFVSWDVPLFQRIITDLFPGMSLFEIFYDVFMMFF